MVKNILEVLENTTNKNPNKIAFADIEKEVTYENFTNSAKRIGSFLTKINQTNKPIAIYIDKKVECIESMMGIVYSGNFYTVLDVASPQERIQTILNTLGATVIVTDQKNLKRQSY